MDKEEIKNELVREVEVLINSDTNPVKRASSVNKLGALGNHLGTLDDFTKKITEKLNEVLQSKNIVIKNKEEKNELIEYLKPTITELIRKYIMG